MPGKPSLVSERAGYITAYTNYNALESLSRSGFE